jgi:hypothetical protein
MPYRNAKDGKYISKDQAKRMDPAKWVKETDKQKPPSKPKPKK